MKKIFSLLVMGVFVFVITGCGPSTEEIASTVESEVAIHVQSTIESLPSATPVDTVTPVPTFTPPATYTPYPTFTPMPTFTPLPTYTPLPTLEPTPEDTPTAVPTATSIPVIQPTSPPPTPTTSNLETMKTELATLLAGLDNYLNSIQKMDRSGWGWKSAPIDCYENTAIRDRITTSVSLDVSNDMPEVQNAYAVYLDVIQRFTTITYPWHEGCLTAIANGEPEKIIDDVQKSDLSIKIGEFKHSLNNVNNALLVLEE